MLEVVQPGPLTTVQDFGRPDSVHLGVPEGGACDRWSLGVANALVGNPAAAAALELTLAGPTLLVRADCAVGLAGADMEAVVDDGSTFAPGTSRVLRAGQRLTFGAAAERGGVRAYLALAGGIDVPRVLGSASTCLVGGFGGVQGRALHPGDVLRAAAGRDVPSPRRWPGGSDPAREATRRALRVAGGPHPEQLPPTALERLLATEYRVSARGDRQAIVLGVAGRGGGVASAEAGRASDRLLSFGVPWGAIQLPPDGRPICLLADHGTVGGYPVVAVVIRADLPLLGQLAPGDPVTFRPIDRLAALAALRRQAADWQAALRTMDGGV